MAYGENADIMNDQITNKNERKKIISKDDLFDQDKIKHGENVTIVSNETDKNKLVTVLNNLMDSSKSSYFLIYREILIKNILKLMSSNEVSIKTCSTVTDLLANRMSNTLNDVIKGNKNIVIFLPLAIKLLNEVKELIEIIAKMKDKDSMISIVSIALTQECRKEISERDNAVKFVSLFYGDHLKLYDIEAFKIESNKKNDDLIDSLMPFSQSSLERSFIRGISSR